MKRYVLCLLAGLSCWAPSARTQDATALAELQENEKRLSAKIEDLEATVQSQQRKLGELEQAMQRLRDDLTRATSNNKNAALESELRQLRDKIKEVDDKRLADNERTLTMLRQLSKGILDKPVEKPTPSVGPPPDNNTKPPKNGAEPSKPPSDKGYEYTVAQGDTLGGIVSKLIKGGVKVTQKQVAEANPNVNWNRLRINQKIFIPAPAQ
jgi:LysM repeat protein